LSPATITQKWGHDLTKQTMRQSKGCSRQELNDVLTCRTTGTASLHQTIMPSNFNTYHMYCVYCSNLYAMANETDQSASFLFLLGGPHQPPPSTPNHPPTYPTPPTPPSSQRTSRPRRPRRLHMHNTGRVLELMDNRAGCKRNALHRCSHKCCN
jgi:hypothetical protein